MSRKSKLTLVFIDSHGNFVDTDPFTLEQDGIPEEYSESTCEHKFCKYAGFRVESSDDEKSTTVFE